MQDVLIYVDRISQPWNPTVDFGGRIAAMLSASVTGACVYPSPQYSPPPFSSADLIATIFDNSRAREAAAKAAEKPFTLWAHSLGIRNASWHVAEGYLPDALAQIGTWHDLLVLDLDSDAPWGSPPDIASLMLASHLPTIVVPTAAKFNGGLECVVIAWNEAPEAVRAIQSALPLLQCAKRVVMLRGERRDTYPEITWKPPFDMSTYLLNHGVKLESWALSSDDEGSGAAILDAASKLNANLLVMGAYGRSRFSEWALGGATRHVLNHASLPVFMRH
jgi:hypothetical protein